MIQLSPGVSKAAALKKEAEDCRFLLELVWASISGALGKQRMPGYLVHHEVGSVTGDLQRHLTALVLTDKQLIINYTDKQDIGYPDRAVTGAEVVTLRVIHSVVVTRSMRHPEKCPVNGSQLVEAWLILAWGATSRLDIDPATCGDPQCEADHGWAGMSVPDDLTVRMSPAGDEWQNVEKLMTFGFLLQEHVG